MACFGKTQLASRQRVTRLLRLRGGFASRDSASHEQPKESWIAIPVPALVPEETFPCRANSRPCGIGTPMRLPCCG
jgi:site-specific DNA recombinase